MKKILLVLLAVPLIALGQHSESQTVEELEMVETLYYKRDSYICSEKDRAKLTDLVYKMRSDSTLKIHIVGYCDKWGGEKVNDRFSYVRAMYIAEWMRSCRVPREQITYIGEGIDTLAENDAEARRVEISKVVKVVVQPKPKPEPKPQPQPKPKPEPKQEVEVQPEPTPTPTEPNTSIQPFAWSQFNLRTNLLYWAGGLMNIGVEYKHPDCNFSLVLNGGYSFLGNSNWNYNLGGWFIAPELRYYIPNNEQWFVGAQFLAGGYNIKVTDTGYQGTVISGGVLAGYKLTLSEHFDMDFTLGVGYGHFEYDTYYHDEPTNTNPYIIKGATKNSIMPIQAGVNLIWKIK